MKTTVKHLSDTRVELTISLDAQELEAAQQVALVKLSKTVKAPGFRKGHVPAHVAAKYVNPVSLSEQTLDDALSKAVAEAYLSEGIQALDRPAVEIKKYVPGSELEFTAETEVLPKVTLGDYKTLKVEKQDTTVSAKDVTEVIDRMRQGAAEKVAVERAAQEGDETVIDFVGMKDGVPFDGGTGTDYPLVLGSHSFIPGFEEGIVGKKAGEHFDLELAFPKDYHVKDLAGQNVTFSTTLKTVNEQKLPDLTDEFAAQAGPFKTVDELKADIKKELTEQKKRQASEKQKDQLVDELIKMSTVPAPDILVKDQESSIEQDMSQNLLYQGLSLDQYIESQGFSTKEEWLDKEVQPVAERRVKAGLVLAELSKAEKIEATEQELDAHVERYKEQYKNNPEAQKQLSTPEARRDIANRLLTEKTVDRLVELASKNS